MRFGYTIIYVLNVAETVEFYRKALGLETKHEEQMYAELNTGETTLAFVEEGAAVHLDLPVHKNRISSPTASIEIAFVTENVDTAYKKAITHGAVAVKEPQIAPWGQTIAYIRDINGVLLEICTPINQ